MQLVSLFDLFSKSIKVTLLPLFISSIGIVLWLVAHNLWVLGDYSESSEISLQYSYVLTKSERPEAQPPRSEEYSFSDKERLNINVMEGNYYWVNLTVTNNTEKEIIRILHIDAALENIASYYQFSINSNQAKKIKIEHSIFQNMFPHISVTIPPKDSISLFVQLKANTNSIAPVNIYEPTTSINTYIAQ